MHAAPLKCTLCALSRHSDCSWVLLALPVPVAVGLLSLLPGVNGPLHFTHQHFQTRSYDSAANCVVAVLFWNEILVQDLSTLRTLTASGRARWMPVLPKAVALKGRGVFPVSALYRESKNRCSMIKSSQSFAPTYSSGQH